MVCPSSPVVPGAGLKQRSRGGSGGYGGGRGSPYARGGRGVGSPRGGAGRGSEALRRSYGSQRGGGGGYGPARGGGRGDQRGAAHHAPPPSESLLGVVGEQDTDAQAMIGLGAYANDEAYEDDAFYDQHEGNTRAAELGQHFRDEAFVHGEHFGCKDYTALIPELGDPDNAVIDMPGTIGATHKPPMSRSSPLKTLGKTILYYLPTLPLLLAVASTLVGPLRRCIPNAPPRTPTLLTAVIMISMIFLMFAPRTSWADDTKHHSCLVTTNMSGSAGINYLLDCACTISIISDSRYIRNMRPASPNFVKGFQGGKAMQFEADLHLPVITTDNKPHTIIVKNVFYDPPLTK